MSRRSASCIGSVHPLLREAPNRVLRNIVGGVDGPPWGKIVGQRSPDTAIAVAVEDGINHGSHLGLAWPPTGAGRRQEGFRTAHCWLVRSLGYGFGFIPFLRSRPPFWNRLLVRPVDSFAAGFVHPWPPRGKIFVKLARFVDVKGNITPARKFRMLLHTNPTRERGECLGTLAGALEDMCDLRARYTPDYKLKALSRACPVDVCHSERGHRW